MYADKWTFDHAVGNLKTETWKKICITNFFIPKLVHRLVVGSPSILLNSLSQAPGHWSHQLLQISPVPHPWGPKLSDFSLPLHHVLGSWVLHNLQGGFGHPQLPSELNGGTFGPRIKVFVDWRHFKNVQGKMTCFKKLFLMVEHSQSTVKYCPLAEKDMGHTK